MGYSSPLTSLKPPFFSQIATQRHLSQAPHLRKSSWKTGQRQQQIQTTVSLVTIGINQLELNKDSVEKHLGSGFV